MQPDDIVSTITQKWATAFTRLDSAALSSLYSKNAFFFGSNPTLYRGNEGVKAYFDQLPRWTAPTVEFSEVRTALVASELINMAGIATFLTEKGAAPLVVKITWGIVREDGDWKIVSHHVSPVAPLI